MKRFLNIFLFSFYAVNSVSVAQESGYQIRNYSSKEYDGFNQVWSSAHDSSGIMYFGTSTNVITFNGSKWGKIPVKFGLPIRSLLYSDNKMFVGTVGEFGFIDFDKNKKPFYHSLVNLLKQKDVLFSDVWKIYKWKGYIIFQTSERIFLYNGTDFKTIEPQNSFALSFVINEHFYVRQRGIGFMELSENFKLTLIKGGEFYKDFPIVAMNDDAANNRFVLAGSRDGIIFLDKITGESNLLDKSKNDFFAQSYPLFMNRPDKKTWFLGTRSGLFLLNNDFSVRTLLNKETGLYDDVVTGTCFSKDSNLWIPLNNGISMLEWNSDGYYISEKSGYKGTPEDIIEFQGKDYLATTHCLFSLDLNDVKKHRFNFTQLKTELTEYWKFVKINGRLFCGASAGLFEVKDDRTEKIHNNWTRFLLKVSDTIPVLFSLEKNFLCVIDVKGKPAIVKRFAFTGDELMNGYAEFKNGQYIVWVSSGEGLLKKLILNSSFEITTQRKYKIIGDSVAGTAFINYNDGELSLTHGTKIFYYHPEKDLDSNSNCFEQAKLYHFKNPASIHFASNFDGKFYSGADEGPQYFPTKTKNGDYKLIVYNLKQNPVKELQGYVTDDSLNVWFMAPEYIILLKTKREKPAEHSFPIVFSYVQTGRDSLSNWYNIPSQTVFPYKNNSFSFEFSGTYFVEPEQTFYRCRLIGADDTSWTAWSHIKHKEYTNLHEGNYSFEVEARNIFNDHNYPCFYSFTISPPWYRTGWAYLMYCISFFGIVYLIVKVSIHRLTQSKIKLEKIVYERTFELEEKKKEITDSIKYALRIQHAILPPLKFIKRLLPDSFILYKPKDIVSGDFYWVEEINGKILFAAVDCTGHGVPGAMMSVIGLKLLNAAVLDKNLSVPSDILGHLDKGVHDTLRQHDATESVKDGMDLALCALNPKTKMLEFSGVNNSLWLVRKNISKTYFPGNARHIFSGDHLLEIKPDKMSIGSNEGGVADIYTNQTIQLEAGDCVYVYSDGYADQFGGPKGKKFKYNKLKELLVSNSHLPVAEQEKILTKVFEDWKGSSEQVDDVLIFCVKV